MELNELLALPRGLTAVIGSGGKTTTMYTLARELSRRGSVICTTTTHIFPPEHIPLLVEPEEAALAAALARDRCLCVGAPGPEGKLTAPAIPMERLAALADYVLVEADGSRNLPLKAHAPHEPVIPSCAARVVLVVGLSGVGQPIATAVHRPERFCALTGLTVGCAADERAVAAVIAAEALADTVFFNQAEGPQRLAAARTMAGLLPGRAIFAGSLREGVWQCLS